MRKVTIPIQGVSPLSWSRYLNAVKEEGEDDRAMEERIWRQRFWEKDGRLFVPAMTIKNSLVDAGMYRAEKIKGKGGKTWTEKFRAGVLAFEDMDLGVGPEALEAEWLMAKASPGTGKRGCGSRVPKCFPRLLKWSGTATVFIVDDVITKNIFEEHMRAVGMFIGWGRFRVINGGYYGRFDVGAVRYEEKNG